MCPLSNHARGRLSHDTPANGVEMTTEGDFPTTPRPMRVEIASDGNVHTPDEKDMKERQAGEGWGSRVLVLAGSSGPGSSSSLIFSLVLVDWCVAGWRAWYLVLGAASCCGFESRRAGSSKTTQGGQVQAQALVSSSPFLELEAFNKDPTGSISVCVSVCGPVFK